jgi:hypothetical protein
MLEMSPLIVSYAFLMKKKLTTSNWEALLSSQSQIAALTSSRVNGTSREIVEEGKSF